MGARVTWRAPLLAQALLLLALAAGTGQGESRSQPPEPPTPPATEGAGAGSPLELLDLGAPAVRYLRAFTTQCWQPDAAAPIAMFDNSWAVALVTIWNDLTVPSNGLGRLVTAAQLQAEGALMIGDGRPADALSVLELAVLFTLYPVHHDAAALSAWHRALASNDTAFATRRLELAHTLALVARAQQAVGLASYSVDALEASVTAGRAAVELLAMAADPAKDAPPAPKPKLRPGQAPKPASRRADKAKPGAGAKPEAAANTIEGLLVLMEQASRHTVAVLQDAPPAELKRLLERRGLKCRSKCSKRSSLLKLLVPALRVPLRLVAVGGEDAASVDSPPDLQAALAAGQPFDGSGDAASAGGTGGSGALARLGRLLAQVVASLQQPLLADVGIRCAAPGGGQLLHRCREQAERQLGGWADGGGAACGAMQAMLSHVSQVEEALWRLDEVLDAAMTGVRLGDGTTWVKHRGYSWVLGAHMAAKLYPAGQGAPAYYQSRRPAEPHAGSTICLDKTYLLDTVLRLDPEGLRGLQYALDNLQYAQFQAGGARPFWRLLALDNPLCSGAACQTGADPLSLVVATEGAHAQGGSGRHAAHSRPPPFDLRFITEQQLQANLAAATDPAARMKNRDPFVAAFISLCVVSCASIYLYSNRVRLVKALTPARGRDATATAAAAGASALAQRSAATTSLRDALAGDSAQRLHAAIDAAEAAGVEKPLVKKAKALLQALKKRKGGAAAGASHRPHSGSARSLQHSGSGLSATSSSSLGRQLSDRSAAILAAAATDAWGGEAPEPGHSQGSSESSSPRDSDSSAEARALAAPALGSASATPPKPIDRPRSPEPEYPTSPGTPAESVHRGSPGDGGGELPSSDACSPLASPLARAGGATDTAGSELPAPASPRPQTSSFTAASTPQAPTGAARLAGTPASPPPRPAGVLGAAAAQRQLTPRQAKKLLRLQHKHAQRLGLASPPEELAAVLAGVPSPIAAALASPARSDSARVEGDEASSAAALDESAADAAAATEDGSSEAAGAEAEEGPQRQLTERELAAIAAREESAPSKQSRSAKKKAKKAAERAAGGGGPSSASGSDAADRPNGHARGGRFDDGLSGAPHPRYGGGAGWHEGDPRYGGPSGGRQQGGTRYEGRFEVSYGPGMEPGPAGQLGGPGGAGYPTRSVRRTLSADPQDWAGLSPLRHAGPGPHHHQQGLHSMAGWQQAQQAYWQGQDGRATLNAHAQEFSPSPNRLPRSVHLGSPQAPYGSDGLLPPGLQGGGYPGGSLQYSPDTSLAYLSAASAQSSLEPAGAVGQTPSLLAQLQQIWGEGGGAGAGRAPAGAALPSGYGAGGLDANLAAAAMLASTEHQQQLAALLMMQQQLELQARGHASRAASADGPDSAPLSPQQLPPASADMLREVLGSPLHRQGARAWPAGGGDGDSLEAAGPSLSLGAEMATATTMALRMMGEPSLELPSGAGAGASASAPPTARPGAARSLSLADAVHSAAQRCSLDRHSPERLSSERQSLEERRSAGASSYGVRGPPTHRIDSMDLEALGFTESGEAE